MATLALLLVSGCVSHATMAERTALLAPTMEYFAPASGGRAPLVILVSGCGGLQGLQGPKKVMKTYAGAATEAGAYAVVMDSFASRGIEFEDAVSTVCSGLRLHGAERAGDILAAEQLAAARWNVEFSGVLLAGWSHGGWAVMELLGAGPDQVGGFRIEPGSRAAKPDAAVLFYPYCGILSGASRDRWTFAGPLLLLTAGDPSRGEAKECTDAVRSARDGLAGTEVVSYAANTHAFDEEDQVPGSEYKYDAEAAARARELFGQFVKSQVKRLK